MTSCVLIGGILYRLRFISSVLLLTTTICAKYILMLVHACYYCHVFANKKIMFCFSKISKWTVYFSEKIFWEITNELSVLYCKFL